MAGGGKKSPAAVAGRRADLGQTSLSRGRVGGGAGQDHGADGMFCGSFAAAGRGGAGDGLVPEASVTGGFRERGARATWPPTSALLRSMQRSAAPPCGNRREGRGLRFGQAQARPVRCRPSAGFGTGTAGEYGLAALVGAASRPEWAGRSLPRHPTMATLPIASCSSFVPYCLFPNRDRGTAYERDDPRPGPHEIEGHG